MSNSNTVDYFNKKIKSAKTFLERWKNSNGRIWNYESSLSNLTIRIERDNFKGNLHVICIEPFRIYGSFKWRLGDLIINYDEVENKVVISESNNFILIHCNDFEIKENVKPVY